MKYLSGLLTFPLLAWAVLTLDARADEQERLLPSLERFLVVSGQGYFPVALRLKDGRIAVVLRGGAGHLGIKGRLDMVFSSEEGKTWTRPTLVVDSPEDDRNPALGQTKDGSLVVATCAWPSTTSRAATSPSSTSWIAPGSSGPRTAARPGASPVPSTSWTSVGVVPTARS